MAILKINLKCIAALLILITIFTVMNCSTAYVHAGFSTTSYLFSPDSSPDETTTSPSVLDSFVPGEPSQNPTRQPDKVKPYEEGTSVPSTPEVDDKVNDLLSKLDQLILYCQIFGHVAKLVIGVCCGILICLLIFYMISRFY